MSGCRGCGFALVLLEGAPLNLSAEAVTWEEALRQRVRAAAADDRAPWSDVHRYGPRRWRLGGVPGAGPPDVHRERPAIVAEIDGGPLSVDQAALASIDQPTLLVAATPSPEAFRQVTDAVAAAIPNSRKHMVEVGI
jgi:pimeloyl-ACP methyl ester carboxylesterase